MVSERMLSTIDAQTARTPTRLVVSSLTNGRDPRMGSVAVPENENRRRPRQRMPPTPKFRNGHLGWDAQATS